MARRKHRRGRPAPDPEAVLAQPRSARRRRQRDPGGESAGAFGQRVEVADYDPAWPVLFGETGSVLRAALGAVALRKRRLAGRFRYDGAGYTDAKNPYVWEIIRRADEWAQLQRWAPGPSDA